ncbi:acetyl-CoA carboxylase biotin carboxylase subunit [Bacillus sp. T33-2]|uniref:acetyl-CoA carboxylase biotin carboxylase subunit n=1 Tax=Bacillus sp. T33-2 TaxID=2054168 RepID=UPI000C75E00C|nr:acetyl-CoA carboxylase biotin carboxylase subunit [Bacillus sp. T33-2]PLR98512.1 acetyl-CoA carboxylase biotin carboxylase subunit [Bacillus sp. T33-2]
MTNIKRVLIANRGEIAVRIIRACKELGIQTVAVFSDADKDSLHVQMADTAVNIGKPAASKSYLNMQNIIETAIKAGADAIHPGYGFLAENDEFADLCELNGIQFIGPSGLLIRQMGNKIAAKEIAKAAGVPVISGTLNKIDNLDEIIAVANETGYPILLKAAAGGGGKGMKLVYDENSLRDEFLRTKAEAKAAFGDGSLYVEKYIENARHVEVQILSDKKGNTIHLGERDCSVQRRHQKLLEEAPCEVINDHVRKQLCESAVKLAQHVNYYSAGTIEYLLDLDTQKFYFIEMNTRVQVEHPVTEFITGVDIVKEQIRIANGEALTITQDDVLLCGHSIECRINAEDFENGFSPSPGKLTKFQIPSGPGVRVDSHCYEGYTISPYYDSLLAKIIVVGANRAEAIQRMRRALSEFVINGVPSTILFHNKLMSDSTFQNNDFNTRWGEEVFIHSINKQEIYSD